MPVTTPADGEYDPLAEYDDNAGNSSIANAVMWLGFVLGGAGVLAGIAGAGILISHDGPNWRGALITCAVMLVIGVGMWFGGAALGGDAGLMAAFFVGRLLGLFRSVGIFFSGLGGLSLVAGGPPGEAIPILAGGLVILGLSFGGPMLADRRR